MKLKELLQAYEVDEIFPAVAVMYPKAKRHKRDFRLAYDLLVDMRPTLSKKNIRYTLMEDPSSKSHFFGANDQTFRTTWDVLLGMNVVRDKFVDLTDEELAANCLLNAIFLGKHPRDFEESYTKLVRA